MGSSNCEVFSKLISEVLPQLTGMAAETLLVLPGWEKSEQCVVGVHDVGDDAFHPSQTMSVMEGSWAPMMCWRAFQSETKWPQYHTVWGS